MYTSADKAIVAVVMGLVYLSNTFLSTHFNVNPDTVNAVIMGVTPFLVYLVPNKAKA